MSEVYRFDEKNHAHYIEGKRVPGVSTISGVVDDGKSGALMGWAAKMVAVYITENLVMSGQRVLVGETPLTPETAGDIFRAAKAHHKTVKEAAGDLGTRVHDLCERSWTEEVTPAEDELPAFTAWMRWKGQYGPVFREAEKHVYSLSHRYAGILDLVADLGGKPYLIDLKTSNRLSPGFFLQVGGYAIAYEEMTGSPILNAGIVRLDKLGLGWEWCDLSPNLDRAKADYLACLNLYQNLKLYNKDIKSALKGGE